MTEVNEFLFTLAADDEDRVLMGAVLDVEWWLFTSGTAATAVLAAEFVT